MKKSLTALAVAAAIAAPMAANADASIYGKIHVSIDYLDNNSPATDLDTLEMGYVASNSSRIGLKGGEDLGGGMKAMWQIESDVAVDGSGTPGFGGRNTYVGLGGGFGSVKIGRHDTPMKGISRKTDLFGDQIGDTRNVLSTANLDARPGNAVMYTSPNMSGATVAVLGSAGEAAQPGYLSAALTYMMGKELYVAAGYEQHSKAVSGGAENEAGYRLGASYSMGDIKINALFQGTMNEGGTKDDGRMSYGAGVAYGMGGMTVKAQFYMAGESDESKNDSGSIFALGVDQKMGKATTVYVAYAMSMNPDDNSKYNMAGAGHNNVAKNFSAATKEDAMGVSLGVVHNF